MLDRIKDACRCYVAPYCNVSGDHSWKRCRQLPSRATLYARFRAEKSLNGFQQIQPRALAATGQRPDVMGGADARAACRTKTVGLQRRPFTRRRKNDLPVRGPGRRCSSATPRAKLSPTEVDTDIGCNAIVLLEPLAEASGDRHLAACAEIRGIAPGDSTLRKQYRRAEQTNLRLSTQILWPAQRFPRR